MSKDRRHIPKASTLMGSLRSMGYSFEAAVADVVDTGPSGDSGTAGEDPLRSDKERKRKSKQSRYGNRRGNQC